MTPGINVVKRAGISHRVHEYLHDSASESYGFEAAEKLGVSAEQVFKTLVVHLDKKQLVVAIVPVASLLSLKQIAKAASGKKAELADRALVERTTGYVLGGVSPLGQKKPLLTFIDMSAKRYDMIYVSAGRRGLEIELNPDDLIQLTTGQYAELRQS